jgi:uncharacterized protein with NRDE domain
MCFIAVAVAVHPSFPFVVAANRDEIFDRPATPLTFWEAHPQLAAGRDLLGGGTWLGLTREGRFAALTNCRTENVSPKPGDQSRGVLVRDYLLNHLETRTAIDTRSIETLRGYGGFNLIAGTTSELNLLCNATGFSSVCSQGLMTLSNTPPEHQWPKTRQGKIEFSKILEQSPDHGTLVARLFDLLRDPRPLATGSEDSIVDSKERHQRVLFVEGVAYGTRASTVILIDRRGRVTFQERSFDNEANCFDESALEFSLEPRHTTIRP